MNNQLPEYCQKIQLTYFAELRVTHSYRMCSKTDV